MPAPTLITELSQTAGSNGPSGTADTPSVLDDYQRAHAAFIAQHRDGKGFSGVASVASATTTSIGGENSLMLEITGTTTITSFGTTYNGPRFLRFAGALTLTHSASLNLPGAANITTVAGDTCIALPNAAGSGWNVTQYQRAAVDPNGVLLKSGGTMTGEIILLNGLVSTELTPVGSIVFFAGSSPPSGWLTVPVAPTDISRATYARLFTALGTTWGSGDGSTTFGMPYIPADQVLVQANANVAAATTGDVKAHTHTGGANVNLGVTSGGAVYGVTASNTGSTGGSNNLPAGIRSLHIIKY